MSVKEKTKAELLQEVEDLKKENEHLSKKIAGKEAYAKAHKGNQVPSKAVEHI